MAHERELIALGVLTSPHGVRGEMRMRVHNPDSELVWRLDELERVWLRSSADEPPREASVASVRRGPKGPLVTVQGTEGREAAEGLQGLELCVRRQDLPPLGDEDEHYVVDLVGLRVRDEEGTVVGEVAGVESYPSVSCLRVRSDDGEREVPMVAPWLERVDVEAGEVVVGALDDVPVQPRPRKRKRKRAGR
ncbi:MAG: ribosome maturation factor RimM [Polyangiales bacterium]